MPHRARRVALAAAIVTLIALPVTGCSSQTTTTPTAPTAVAASAPQAFSEVDPARFAAGMAVPGTVVLDVRTPAEFAAGHLRGAVNLDVENSGFDAQIAALNKTVPYAVYCRSGNRSGVALEKMRAAGFTTAYHLGGGIGAWQAAGGEVVK